MRRLPMTDDYATTVLEARMSEEIFKSRNAAFYIWVSRA